MVSGETEWGRTPSSPGGYSTRRPAPIYTQGDFKLSEIREISEKYAEIGRRLIKRDKLLRSIRDSEVRIVYLSSDHEKKSKGIVICGECEKIPDKYKWIIPYDFSITVFEPNVEHFDDRQLRILILHELLHVGIELDGNEEKYFVRPHDIEDFRSIIRRYGKDWSVDKTRKAERTGD